MPVYVFRCPTCGAENDHLLPLGDTAPRPCPTDGCDGIATHKIARVAVRYEAFGFTATDTLVSDPTGKNFRELRTKAEEISDTSQ